jgi:hypothetical protein
LLWEALATIPDSYTVFVHLLDDSGRLLAQHDGIPVGGTRPTPTWQPGERLLDRHELLVPDDVAGNGRLVVGLYQTETVTRRPFVGSIDAIQVGNVQFR